MVSASPKVSVVIPAYNVEQWIETTIRSVFDQSFSDWEVIVVDDGSQDRTPSIVEDIGHPKVQLVVQENQGPTAARNHGFSHARGEYVALLDADDQYEKGFLERTVKFLDDHREFGVVATNQYLVSRSGVKTVAFGNSAYLPTRSTPYAVNYCRARLVERCFPSNTAMVLRRELIGKLGGYDPTLFGGEEVELMLRWTRACKLGYISDPLASHFDRPGSFIKDLDRSIRARVHLWQQVILEDLEYSKDHSAYPRLRNMCLFRLTAVAIASGRFDHLHSIAAIWPESSWDRYYVAGKFLLALPRFVQRFIHFSIGRLDAVRLRNDPGTRTGRAAKNGQP